MDVENSPVVEDSPHLAARPILRPSSPGISHQHGTHGITEDLRRKGSGTGEMLGSLGIF